MLGSIEQKITNLRFPINKLSSYECLMRSMRFYIKESSFYCILYSFFFAFIQTVYGLQCIFWKTRARSRALIYVECHISNVNFSCLFHVIESEICQIRSFRLSESSILQIFYEISFLKDPNGAKNIFHI